MMREVGYTQLRLTAVAADPLLLIPAGLEDPADLIADLEAGFGRLAAADRCAP